jgi:hypothetical protein
MPVLRETVQDNTIFAENKKIDLRKYIGKGENYSRQMHRIILCGK